MLISHPPVFKLARVAIVSGDNFYSFAYAETGMDIAQMVEKAKEVTRAMLSPDQIEDSAPDSAPTQDDVPAPVSSPTWVGPTPDSNAPPTWYHNSLYGALRTHHFHLAPPPQLSYTV